MPHYPSKACKETRPSVKCLVAPYEADAQLAYMCRAGLVDAVVTEDSDAVPYGCTEIITKLDRSGSCQCLTLSDVYSLPSSTDFRLFDRTMMIVACVAAGCDYASSLSGIGVKRSVKYVSRHRTAQRLLRALRFEGIVPLTEAEWPSNGSASKIYQYELDFYRAMMTFHHQTVFDPVTRKVRHLMDLPRLGTCATDCSIDSSDLGRMYSIFLDPLLEDCSFSPKLNFLGPFINSTHACEIADGLRDPESMQLFDLSASFASPTSVAVSSPGVSSFLPKRQGSEMVSKPKPAGLKAAAIKNKYTHYMHNESLLDCGFNSMARSEDKEGNCNIASIK